MIFARYAGAVPIAAVCLTVAVVLLVRVTLDAHEPADSPVDAAPPSVATPGTLRWVAVGDIGHLNSSSNDIAAAIGTTCARLGCDFGILLGDNLYPRGMQKDDDPRMHQLFSKLYAPIGIPFYAVLGNHDDNPLDPATARREVEFSSYAPLFRMPGRMYAFATDSAEFVAFDTPRIFWFGGDAHATWIRGGDRRKPWRVAFGHHPFRSNGPHGNAGAYEGWRHIPYLSGNSLETFFKQHLCGEFDLYLSGHDHNQQLIEHCGLTLVVTGAGSGSREVVERGNTPLFTSDKTGFVWIELSTQLLVRFFDGQGHLLYEHVRLR